MLYRLFVIITVLVLASAALAGDLSTGDISALQEKAKKDAAGMALPRNDYEALGKEKAEEAYKVYQSEEFQKKLALERERIQKEVFGREAYYRDSKKGSSTGGLGPNEWIYVFLSSSIPKETLRRYTSAAGALGDRNVRFVMRGFIGDAKYIKPTLRFVKDLLLEDPNCDPLKNKCRTYDTAVIIDPMLFEHYHVTRVPAFVYATVSGLKDPEKSEGLESNITISAFHTVRGDVSFEYVLEAFERETHSAGVSALLAGMRKGYYQK
ncbi:MAG: type-F conjugative transfer system pilin assembly protein TrbC [Syntrophorhabdales bacterium]|jgi:type-F conjugative transfer system pilin assembly protein TrbC